MTKPFRIAILLGSALVVLIVAAVLVAWLVIGTDRVRERVEAGLGKALDMEVDIGQPLQVGLLQGVNVTLADLEARRAGQVVATAESIDVRLALLGLLTGSVRPVAVSIVQPELSVERYGPGAFNVYESAPESEPGPFDKLSLQRVRVSEARVTWFDHPSELGWTFDHCDLELLKFGHAGGSLEQTLATVRAEGDLKCQAVSQGRFSATGLSVGISGNNGVVELAPINAIVFEGRASGRIEADFSSDTPDFSLESRLADLDLGAFMAAMMVPEQSSTGTLELELALDSHGTTWQEVRNSIAGSASLHAGELVIDGVDLDDELDDYARTQRFNLVDVGAVLLAGPFGLAATRGHAMSGLLGGASGSTSIDRMVSEWAVEGGVAQARDVAFRTRENRLALAGALDFGNYRFKDMRVAVIDRDGCAIVEQRITGPFREPEIERPNFLVAVAGPLLDLVKRGVDSVTDDDCKAFYSGSIEHPDKKDSPDGP